MHLESRTRFADRVIATLARRQHGVVGRWQLVRAGVTAQQIKTRLRARHFTELHRGVYLVGAVPSPHAHEMAALLACRLDGALSHRSAAHLWNLLPYPAPAPVWITLPPGRSARRLGLKVIRANLTPTDIRRRDGMARTSPPRTVLDMAALLDPDALEALVAEAQFRRLASDAELRRQIERNMGRRGVRALRHILDLSGGPRRTRSPAERQLLRLLRSNSIEGYEVNAGIHGYEVDFLWREEGFAVEVDGYDAHSGRVAFERDRLKVAKLEAAGLMVMPVTGRQVRDESDQVLGRIRATLRIRAGASRPR